MDIKPLNILIKSGQPVFSDFGCACLEADVAAGRVRLWWHSPMHANTKLVAGGPPTACMDVWAIGITCWELLAGARRLSLEDLRGPLPGVLEGRGGNQFGQQCFLGSVTCLCFDTDVRLLAALPGWLLPCQQ